MHSILNGTTPSARDQPLTAAINVAGVLTSAVLSATDLRFEQPRDVSHWPKKLQRPLKERQEALAFIETARCLIFRVDDNRERCDFATDCAKQRVGKQEAAVASSLIGLVDGKPAQERRWNERILGKFARDVGGKFSECH